MFKAVNAICWAASASVPILATTKSIVMKPADESTCSSDAGKAQMQQLLADLEMRSPGSRATQRDATPPGQQQTEQNGRGDHSCNRRTPGAPYDTQLRQSEVPEDQTVRKHEIHNIAHDRGIQRRAAVADAAKDCASDERQQQKDAEGRGDLQVWVAYSATSGSVSKSPIRRVASR